EHVRSGRPEDAALVGLALSGGGIRSACFGLGVLQALQMLKLFQHLDYVSTVSGGGYIGGWLQAAIANGRPRAIELQGEEPREIRFLRAYSNYLTPKLGLFSGDTWAAVLFVLTVGASIANTARPVRASGGTKAGAAFADQRTVYATVVVPGLVATWLVSTVMWAWAREAGFTAGVAAEVSGLAALFYAGIWALGL